MMGYSKAQGFLSSLSIQFQLPSLWFPNLIFMFLAASQYPDSNKVDEPAIAPYSLVSE